jgi:hypothetical protein
MRRWASFWSCGQAAKSLGEEGMPAREVLPLRARVEILRSRKDGVVAMSAAMCGPDASVRPLDERLRTRSEGTRETAVVLALEGCAMAAHSSQTPRSPRPFEAKSSVARAGESERREMRWGTE